MTIEEAIKARHSVRSYTDQKIDPSTVDALRLEIEKCNKESGLNTQLLIDYPGVFDGFLARYGRFKNVSNYLALVGKKDEGVDEIIGWYGERLVLLAQQLGLNSCWVGGTYSKNKCPAIIEQGEKLRCVISLGYGESEGKPRKSKPMEELCKVEGVTPTWFKLGMEAAMLAPTAMNQQHFLFTLSDDKVSAKSTGGFFSEVDLGIVKYHFEIGAGKESFSWA